MSDPVIRLASAAVCLAVSYSLCYTTAIDKVAGDSFRWEIWLEVRIYTKPGCPHCEMARKFYRERGIAFEELNAQDNLAIRREMLSITDGDPTVPVIVEDGQLKQIGWEGRG